MFKSQKRGIVALAIFVVVAVLAAVLWMVFTKTTHIAVVNGERISRRDFIDKLERQAGEDVLRQMIDETLIRQSASKSKVSVSKDEVDKEISRLRREIGPQFDTMLAMYNMTEASLRESLEMNLLVFELSTKDVLITDEEIRQYFDEHKADFDEPEQVRASHILVGSKEEAEEVKKRLNAGEDFVEVAKQVSIDPGSASMGGDLGFFPRGRMTEGFEKVAFSLPVGQTSGVVSTEFGYHIIRVTDKIPARSAVFENVRDEIIRSLKGQKAKSPAQLASELKLESDITVFSDRYKSLSSSPTGLR